MIKDFFKKLAKRFVFLKADVNDPNQNILAEVEAAAEDKEEGKTPEQQIAEAVDQKVSEGFDTALKEIKTPTGAGGVNVTVNPEISINIVLGALGNLDTAQKGQVKDAVVSEKDRLEKEGADPEVVDKAEQVIEAIEESEKMDQEEKQAEEDKEKGKKEAEAEAEEEAKAQPEAKAAPEEGSKTDQEKPATETEGGEPPVNMIPPTQVGEAPGVSPAPKKSGSVDQDSTAPAPGAGDVADQTSSEPPAASSQTPSEVAPSKAPSKKADEAAAKSPAEPSSPKKSKETKFDTKARAKKRQRYREISNLIANSVGPHSMRIKAHKDGAKVVDISRHELGLLTEAMKRSELRLSKIKKNEKGEYTLIVSKNKAAEEKRLMRDIASKLESGGDISVFERQEFVSARMDRVMQNIDPENLKTEAGRKQALRMAMNSIFDSLKEINTQRLVVRRSKFGRRMKSKLLHLGRTGRDKLDEVMDEKWGSKYRLAKGVGKLALVGGAGSVFLGSALTGLAAYGGYKVGDAIGEKLMGKKHRLADLHQVVMKKEKGEKKIYKARASLYDPKVNQAEKALRDEIMSDLVAKFEHQTEGLDLNNNPELAFNAIMEISEKAGSDIFKHY